jgi:hypothetical protein
MNTDKQPADRQPFEKALYLFSLIQQNVQLVAEEVVATYPKDRQSIDSAKLGAMECWVDRCCGLLSASDVEYLTELLEKKVDKPSSRS